MKKLLLCSMIFCFAAFAKSHASPSEKGSPGGCSIECVSDVTANADFIAPDMKVSARVCDLVNCDLSVNTNAVSKICKVNLEPFKPCKAIALKRPGWNRVDNYKTIHLLNKSYLTSAPASNLMNGNYCSLRS